MKKKFEQVKIPNLDKAEFTKKTKTIIGVGVKKKRIEDKRTIYMSDENWQKLQILAAYKNIKVSHIIEELVEEYLQKTGIPLK